MSTIQYATKDFQVEIKANEAKREIEAYASTWERDLGGDTILKGAYAETLAKRFDGGKKRDIKVLWQHDPSQPIGLPIHMEEDSKGLYTVSKLSDTPKGNEAIRLALDGVVDKMSIGYDTILSKDDGDGGRILQKLELFEYSLVTFPMNTGASILGAKAADWATVERVAQMLKTLGSGDLAFFLKENKEGKALDKERLLELLGAATESLRAVADYVEADGEDDTSDPVDDPASLEGNDPASTSAEDDDDESKAIKRMFEELKTIK